jgi:hypothetical protein
MTDNSNRPTWKPFSAYLERLAKQREERGEPPAPEVHDDQYWIERAKWHEEQQK